MRAFRVLVSSWDRAGRFDVHLPPRADEKTPQRPHSCGPRPLKWTEALAPKRREGVQVPIKRKKETEKDSGWRARGRGRALKGRDGGEKSSLGGTNAPSMLLALGSE